MKHVEITITADGMSAQIMSVTEEELSFILKMAKGFNKMREGKEPSAIYLPEVCVEIIPEDEVAERLSAPTDAGT